VVASFNHDFSLLLGRQQSGTLRLREDAVGLSYEIDLPDTTIGRDVATLLERRDLRGSSFAFVARKDEWTKAGGRSVRSVLDMRLVEVGPVVHPAYTTSSVGLGGGQPHLQLVGAGEREEPVFYPRHAAELGTPRPDERPAPRTGLSWLYS
jgi:HK97 family phage prohead protease